MNKVRYGKLTYIICAIRQEYYIKSQPQIELKGLHRTYKKKGEMHELLVIRTDRSL